MKLNWTIVLVVVALAAVIAGVVVYATRFKSADYTTRNDRPNGPEASKDGLTIQVMGNSSDPGGLWLRSSGFTPNGSYHTDVHYPQDSPQKGALYTFIRDGEADASGTTPGWRWDPNITDTGRPDPRGAYSLTMYDNITGKQVSTTFTVA